ncbi:MAG TPA: hypothetical protein VNA20_01625 [Frankiaceae bacterium]|nr:hypothetical protein [Frankiaceae bacterium]
MRILRLQRAAVVLAAASALLAPRTAHAVNAEHVEWAGTGHSNCTTGTSAGWTCTYEVFSHTCPEVAVAGVPLASCYVWVRAVVKIAPVLNATGRLVGCTSGGNVVLTGSHVYFDSTFDEFDNDSINALVVGQMNDSFADGKPGAFELTAFEEGQSEISSAYWLVSASLTGSCKRGAEYVYGTGAGTVDVQI